MSQSIRPLRIQKNTQASSPSKMGTPSSQRPLAELSPMERRRNSPSYHPNLKKSKFGGETSPFDSSPFPSNSPRLYWQSRDPASPSRLNAENRNPKNDRDGSPSATKRSSIENLKRASRVKNSNMFAREHKQEYDPSSSPNIERPLATGRPLRALKNGNEHPSKGVEGVRKENLLESSKIPIYSPPRSPTKSNEMLGISKSPSKSQISPTKSSLSTKSRYAQTVPIGFEDGKSEDEDSGADHELPPGKSLHRHAKSVTFDAAPPQINEYEMTTPDPSSVASGSREGSYESVENEEEDSFDRGSSIERDDSFDESLEDTDKTPVVLPEDWRFMSPATANDDLASHIENPFDGPESSPAPTARPSSAVDARLSPSRTDSANSSGERRPLPPLPAIAISTLPRARSNSASSISATAERMSNPQRILPSPPQPASITKLEIQGMGGCSMSIEERLHLMMIQDEEKSKPSADEQREKSPRQRIHSNTPDRLDESQASKIHIYEDEIQIEPATSLDEFKLPPRISRESILRKVRSQRDLKENIYEYSSPVPEQLLNPGPLDELDPDTPIPSLECEQQVNPVEDEVVIKQEDDGEDSDIDLYSIPDLYSQQFHNESYMDSIEGHQEFEDAPSHISNHDDDDGESHYSGDFKTEEQEKGKSSSIIDDEGPPTPKAAQPIGEECIPNTTKNREILSQFSSILEEQDFKLGLEPFLTPSPPTNEEPTKNAQLETIEQFGKSLERPVTPETPLEPPHFQGQYNGSDSEPRTPDSVIRHPITESELLESPSIPEPIATIKAPGTKLKTRPSITPADARSMAETRRQVSGDIPMVPPIPEKHQDHPRVVPESEPVSLEGRELRSSDEAFETESSKQTKRKSSLVQLEITVEKNGDGLGFGLDREFDRVIEAQKKGYLMRQNTKVVVASSASHESTIESLDSHEQPSRGTRSAGNSPRKSAQAQPWTTEPWNGKVRRKSLRLSGGSPQKKPVAGPAPPLPGQQSNVASGLGSVNEDENILSVEEVEEGGERGVLFVKVARVKDLDLPLPKGERSYFALTLDNGLHCVTTAWLELGKTAPIGQEFELIVLNDLEFQLTLHTKIEEPKVKPVVESPTKVIKTPMSSTFSRVFASPKKRKELELKQQEEAQKAERQRQQEAQAARRANQPTAWDLLHELVAKDGSFARSYVCLKDYESKAYGRPFTVDIPCFNEWATEEAQTTSSVKSKRSTTRGSVQRRAPYKIGKLELQLLFVPRPRGSKEEDMPKSMNACIRELKEAETAKPKRWEGTLSQQGGDCPYWRRRFFVLEGSKFTAHHEVTHQPRATIHLAGATKLIDDKSALMQRETSGRGGGRRKSAFAEEEEGYMFVEEGFRIRFANGETIDFYADSAEEKDGWMKALAEVIGKEPAKAKAWTDLVLARQRKSSSNSSRTASGGQSQKKAPTPRSAPHILQAPSSQHTFAITPAERNPRQSVTGHRRADPAKTRSMIF